MSNRLIICIALSRPECLFTSVLVHITLHFHYVSRDGVLCFQICGHEGI